jgi:uncharacterized protein YacL
MEREKGVRTPQEKWSERMAEDKRTRGKKGADLLDEVDSSIYDRTLCTLRAVATDLPY